MVIPGSRSGRHYFECYPHPALIALFNLESVLPYKRHKRNREAWNRAHDLLGTLEQGPFPVTNIRNVLLHLRDFTKANEDAIDAIISAYIGAYWWLYGTNHSMMLGDIETGYIVTPTNELTRQCYDARFPGRINRGGSAPRPNPPPAVQNERSNSLANATEIHRNGQWLGPVSIRCNDSKANLWCKHNSWMIRNNCEGHQLVVLCLNVDSEPTLTFIPLFRSRSTAMHKVACEYLKTVRNERSGAS